MQFFIPGVILLSCVPIIFLPSDKIRLMLGLALLSLLLGVGACIWASAVTENFVAEHAWIAGSPLHPGVSLFFGGAMLLFSMGICIALGVRKLLVYLKFLSPR